MLVEKHIGVYYRSIPRILEVFVNKYKEMSIVKDGLLTGSGHTCPRLTITVVPSGILSQDSERLKKLEDLLFELLQNNQIVGYTDF